MVWIMATRATMNISLTPAMRDWVDRLVAAGDYGTASEYIRELVRADQARRARDQISEELRSVLARGDKAPMTPKDWAEIRRAVSERASAGKRRRRAS